MNEGSAPRFLTARWTDLVMLNYEVDPTILHALVPSGVDLDDWRGRYLMSMVGFRFGDTRLLGWGIPFHRDFDEVNLRFYVRRRAGGELRRGVVFVREIVPRRAIAWIANAVYNEKYVALPMQHDFKFADGRGRYRYCWSTGGRANALGASVVGAARVPDAGSEQAFVTEHYWGYAGQRDGSTVEYQVEHPPWEVWAGQDPVFECDVAGFYGEGFAPFLSRQPTSTFVARGSEVLVRRGRRLPPEQG